MSTSSIHHRAKHRSRVRRLALPATVVFGLTLAAQWSNPFDLALWSPAHAEGPSPATKKVEPRVVDFNKLAKQKAEARRLLDAARKAAAKGDFETARRHADQAATIPVEWNLGETSPKKFLEDLQSDPQRFSEVITEVTETPRVDVSRKQNRQRRTLDFETPNPVADRDVIELAFPDDRPGVTETADEDLSSTDEPPTLKIKQAAPSRSANADMPKTQRTPGFKTSNSATSEPETAAPAPRTKQRFVPIPSLEELAKSAPVSDSPASQSPKEMVSSFKEPAFTTAKRSETIRPLADEVVVIPAGSIENSNSANSSDRWQSQPQKYEVTPLPISATPTTVIHEIRITERPASVDQAANANSASASQLLMNLNSLMMAGLFGALLLLIVVAVTVLRKFGPNPQFTFKVEVNHPNAVATSESMTKTAAHVAPVTQIASIYALKRQMEEALEHEQEDTMMRQVFDDNLKLREQLEETQIAA